MRRSICYSEPQVARTGQTSTWKFHYTTATTLPKGTRLKFDLLSPGRDIDWEVPSADLDEEANVIFAELEDGEIIELEEVETPDSIVPQYEFTLPVPLKIGKKLTIVMGVPPTHDGAPEEFGNECQLTVQRRRPLYLYIDPKGKGNYKDPEIFTIDIRGSKLNSIQILTPSFVAKNKRFDITVRFEDEYGNLTNSAPEETLIELSYEHLRENLNWKLFLQWFAAKFHLSHSSFRSPQMGHEEPPSFFFFGDSPHPRFRRDFPVKIKPMASPVITKPIKMIAAMIVKMRLFILFPCRRQLRTEINPNRRAPGNMPIFLRHF